jgi:cytochrome c556
MRNIVQVVVTVATVGVIGLATGLISAQTPGAPQQRTYVWFGELVSIDAAAKTATVKAQTTDAVAGYVDRFKPGEKVMMVWDMISTLEADKVLYVAEFQEMNKSKIDFGYILPAEFVSADKAAKTMTFKTTVPDSVVQSASSIPAGRWLKVTAPMSQATEAARLNAVEASAVRPVPTPRPKPVEKVAVAPPVTKVATPEDYARAMKAIGAANGSTNTALQSGAAPDAKLHLASARATMAAVEQFWVEMKKDDPAMIAKDAVAKMDALDKALSATDTAAAAAAAKEVGATCAACHGKYREQDPTTKAYIIKAGTL